MISNIRITAARLAALLVLAALLCAGVQMAVSAENVMTIGIGNFAGIGNDPTIYQSNNGSWPIQDHHHYTHWEPLITIIH